MLLTLIKCPMLNRVKHISLLLSHSFRWPFLLSHSFSLIFPSLSFFFFLSLPFSLSLLLFLPPHAFSLTSPRLTLFFLTFSSLTHTHFVSLFLSFPKLSFSLTLFSLSLTLCHSLYLTSSSLSLFFSLSLPLIYSLSLTSPSLVLFVPPPLSLSLSFP